MAMRSLSFGVRLRDGTRTLRVRRGAGRGYVVEDRDARRDTRRRDHASLEGALRDLAGAWRTRLH